jgi:hypothetical protein
MKKILEANMFGTSYKTVGGRNILCQSSIMYNISHY